MTNRQRLTYAILYTRTAEMSPPGELHLTFEEFQDLKTDMGFVSLFFWGTSTALPTEFECNGIRCVIAERSRPLR